MCRVATNRLAARRCVSLLGLLLHGRKGAVGIYAALLLPVLAGTALLAVDASRLFNLQTALQKGADALALAGAAELDRKPDSITRNRRIQDAPIERLGDADFLDHLETVRANACEMVYRHHIFTIPSSFPVGHFLVDFIPNVLLAGLGLVK